MLETSTLFHLNKKFNRITLRIVKNTYQLNFNAYDMGHDDQHSACNRRRRGYFVGVAGTGMSPMALFLAGKGDEVYGSDRAFAQKEKNQDYKELSRHGINCVMQDGEHLPTDLDFAVVSTAVEDTNPDIKEIKRRNVKIMHRSELLAEIASNHCGGAICVGGTAGKSTTTHLIYQLLHGAGKQPCMIAGAADNNVKRGGEPGNFDNSGDGPLVFEGDESDKSIVRYNPTMSVITNVGHDHHEIDVTVGLFQTVADNTADTVVLNSGDENLRRLNCKKRVTFALAEKDNNADFKVTDLKHTSEGITFSINGVPFAYHSIGLHNALNIAAAVAMASVYGVNVEECAKILSKFGGVYRRGNIIGKNANGSLLVDDFAHTPEEVAETIRTLASFSDKVYAVYQPHGFGPLRKTYEQMAILLKEVMRTQDVFYLADVYYEGGTTDMSIGSKFVADYFTSQGINCVYVQDRNEIPAMIKKESKANDSIVIMGARDKSLADYACSFKG